MSNTSTYDRRLPAEWEPQSFLQLTFPHTNSDWEYLLQEASACFVNIIEAAARFQPVLVVCDSITRVKSYFSDCTNIHFTEVPSNDTWARDHGGITVLTDDGAVVQDYIFNGWGKNSRPDLIIKLPENCLNKALFKTANWRVSVLCWKEALSKAMVKEQF